jgi:hypothetical protein
MSRGRKSTDKYPADTQQKHNQENHTHAKNGFFYKHEYRTPENLRFDARSIVSRTLSI